MKNYEEEYIKNMIEKGKKEINFKDNLDVEVKAWFGEKKITIDGINYFNIVKGIIVLSHKVEIGRYDFEKGNLERPVRVDNIIVAKDMVNLLNDFVGYEKYGIKEKEMKKFEKFKLNYKDNMSDYEIGELFSMNGGRL